jgi:hypothetical protein
MQKKKVGPWKSSEANKPPKELIKGMHIQRRAATEDQGCMGKHLKWKLLDQKKRCMHGVGMKLPIQFIPLAASRPQGRRERTNDAHTPASQLIQKRIMKKGLQNVRI